MDYIRDFEFRGMWNKVDVLWHNLHEDVNILVGINGKGKTTLLDAINAYYNRSKGDSFQKKYGDKIIGTPLDCPVFYIQSADTPSNVKKKGNSPLYENLMGVVLQNEKSNSFFNYRMRALNYVDEAPRVSARIEMLFSVIDTFFCQTDKHVEIDKEHNLLVFKSGSHPEESITLDLLSAGEKQLLYMLLTVFLLDEKPAVLLLDEPELSLHIEWQEKLISALRKLNSRCQLIVTTHSPSIFASGWEDRLTFMEDLISEER